MTVLLGAVGPSTYWYLTRSTGAVALLLLTFSLALGIAGVSRFSRTHPDPAPRNCSGPAETDRERTRQRTLPCSTIRWKKPPAFSVSPRTS
jgi:hypothetical protein